MDTKGNAKKGGARAGAGRPKTSTRDDVAVKLDRKLVEKARQVADLRGISLAEYLSEIARDQVDRDFGTADK